MERTALHEAGHAVLAWSFGVAPGADLYLDLEKESGGAPFVLSSVAHLKPVEQIAVALAGFEAEQTFKPPGKKRRAADDFHDKVPTILRNNGASLDEPQGKALRKNGRARAKRRLLKHDRKVRAVARHLVEHHRVSPALFEALMKAPNL
jgi:hypothetical protein